MSAAGAGRFAVVCGTIALVSGAAVWTFAAERGPETLRWSLLGWAVMAVSGVGAGVWMARVHGRPGTGFLLALGTGMLARLFGAAAGALWAAQHGVEAVWAYLAGLSAGYLPLQAFESVWFLRRTRGRG